MVYKFKDKQGPLVAGKFFTYNEGDEKIGLYIKRNGDFFCVKCTLLLFNGKIKFMIHTPGNKIGQLVDVVGNVIVDDDEHDYRCEMELINMSIAKRVLGDI